MLYCQTFSYYYSYNIFGLRSYMKRVFLSMSLAALPLCALADGEVSSGVFFGIDTGYTIGFQTNTSNNQGAQNNQSTTTVTTAPNYLNIGVKLGYNFYFSGSFGLRGYVDYIYGMNLTNIHTTESGITVTQHDGTHLHYVNLNVDVLINFFSSDSVTFGSFVGIGFGYGAMIQTGVQNNGNISTTRNIGDGFIMPINLGLSLIAGGKHRIDLTMKIPTFGIRQNPINNQGGGGNNNQQITDRHLIGMIGYSYTF